MLAVTLAALVLTSCGGQGIDEDAWRTDIEQLMGSSADPGEFEDLREFYVDDICQDDEESMEAYGAVAADEGDQRTIELARISISYACPDLLPAFERGQ